MIFFMAQQVRQLMDKCEQKKIFIQVMINGDDMSRMPCRRCVISVARCTAAGDFKFYFILDEPVGALRNRIVREIFTKHLLNIFSSHLIISATADMQGNLPY